MIRDEDDEGWVSAARRERLDQVKREVCWGEFESSLRAFEAQDWRQLPQRRQGLAEFKSFMNVHVSMRELLTAAYRERLDLLSAAKPSLPPVLFENGLSADLVETSERVYHHLRNMGRDCGKDFTDVPGG